MKLWILLGIIFVLSGCNEAAKKPYSDPNKPVYTLTEEEVNTIFDYKNAEADLAAKEKVLADLRAFRIQMVWAVLGAGALAIFLSPKIGISLVVLFGAMIGFAEALMKYSVEIGWASMGLGALMLAYVLWINRKKLFFAEKVVTAVVAGNEKFKAATPLDQQDIFKAAQNEAQGSTPEVKSKITEFIETVRSNL